MVKMFWMILFSIQLIAHRVAPYVNPHCDIPTCKTDHLLCNFNGIVLNRSCFKKGWITNKRLDGTELNMILETHNHLRSNIALGKNICQDNLILGTAANMNQLVYDGQLSFIAATWMRDCYEDNTKCLDVERFKVGVNHVLHFQSNKTEIDALRDMLDLWINECNDFHRIDVTNYKVGHVFTDVQNFTQMIWGNTTKIGCALAVFHLPPAESFEYLDYEGIDYHYWLLCLYGPKCCETSVVYDMGTTCIKCPAKTTCQFGLCKEEKEGSSMHTTDIALQMILVSWLLFDILV